MSGAITGAKSVVRGILARLGYELRRNGASRTLALPEVTESDRAIIRRTRPYTMTSPERLWAVIAAVHYVTSKGIPGDFCECGVWRGGASMAAAFKFLECGHPLPRLWIFDTFEGMPPPSSEDTISAGKVSAHEILAASPETRAIASLDEVQRNLYSTGYPQELITFVKGRVEETLLDHQVVPKNLSILRLDTDWYASTRVELEVLYARLSPGGVLLIDDYGHWDGARKAVDEFFAAPERKVLLLPSDYTGRAGVKVA